MNQNKNFANANRQGVTIILFAILLPVLVLLSMIAINLAHMQLTRTELKIATDAAARAGGRAWSEFNDVDTARDFARQVAEMNTVSGQPLALSVNPADNQMIFGESTRNGNGRFDFTPLSEAEFANGVLASGFQVNAEREVPLFFNIRGTNSFTPAASSVASQVERDIALVIDRSGSMFSFEGQNTNPGQGEQFLFDTMTALYEDPANEITRDEYFQSIADYQDLAEAADMRPRDRFYVPKVLDLLSGDLLEYATTTNSDYHTETRAAKMSRWHGLEIAYDAFFDVLDATDPEELVSVVTFNNSARVDASLSSDLAALRPIPADIWPDGGTAVGTGMLEGFASLNVANGRPNAAQTVIVLSDGINRTGTAPTTAARQIVADNPRVVIHTVTFGAEANTTEMAEVAAIGSGLHYHATTTLQLVEVFKKLAAVQRTVITN